MELFSVMKTSVCMATYNGEKYIYAQLESILKQLSENDEVIISDDSSTDKTVDIIRNFNDKRIKLYEHDSVHSPVLNFENALKKASGDIIFLSDQDDIWLDNKVEVVMKLLHSYVLVVSDCVVVNEAGEVIADSFFKLRGAGPGFFNNLIKSSFIGCCMAFNRNIMTKALPFPQNIPMHDMWIGLIGELFGETYFCREQLVKYRRHSSNLSPMSGENTYSVAEKLKFRLNLLYHIIRRYTKITLTTSNTSHKCF
jgi:glycosyltransferase involved in cell wall biosynthesis